MREHQHNFAGRGPIKLQSGGIHSAPGVSLRIKTGRIRLLVRHVETAQFVRNVIIGRELRDAIMQAHIASQDGTCCAFICINEVVRGFYVRGARVDCAPMHLPAALRTIPLGGKGARTAFLPGLEYSERERMEKMAS